MDINNLDDVVDVICPVYNQAPYIEECLKSILNQEEVNVVIHLIDDASTDNSAAIIRNYSQEYPGQIKVYYNKINHGNAVRSIAANKLDLNGNFWTYIESDDYLTNNRKFISQIEQLKKDDTLIATATRCILWDTKTNSKQLIKPDLSRWNFYDLVSKKNSYKMYCHISSLVWKSETHLIKHQLSPLTAIKKGESESEVFLVHRILKESKKYIGFQDIEGSCYRYTGTGIWSSLDEKSQEIMNQNLQVSIDAITPIKFKLKMKLINFFEPRWIRKS